MTGYRRASTLIETIIALVLLSGCLLLVGALLHRSSQYQRRSESLLESAALADKVMGEVRGWARNGSNYDSNWSYWQGRTVSDPDYPGLSARVDVQTTGVTVLSPDNLTELAYSNPREILKGAIRVRILAGPDLNSPVGRASLWSQIAPPSPQASGAHIVVNINNGAPMAHNETRSFTATAFDGGGRSLPHCCFEWRVRNQSGEANSTGQSRDGRSFGIIYNTTREEGDPPVTVYASGSVSIEAEARIGGRLIVGSTGVTLLPGP